MGAVAVDPPPRSVDPRIGLLNVPDDLGGGRRVGSEWGGAAEMMAWRHARSDVSGAVHNVRRGAAQL